MSTSLIFGIELEFIAVFKKGAFRKPTSSPSSDYDEDEADIITAIEQNLENHNILASQKFTYDRWHIHQDALDLSPAERRSLPKGYGELAIEISSRKLSFGDDWQEEIRGVLRVLHWMCGRYGCQFLTNSSTGLHVHIGNPEGHSLTTVKRMTQIASAHERNLDKIHSADRVIDLIAAADQDLDNDYPRPLFAGLSFFHALSESGKSGYVLDVMDEIEAKTSFKELGDICRVRYQGRPLDGHSCTLNLDNLYRDPKRSIHDASVTWTGTMEFRQHGGDLHGEEIMFYTGFLADLTLYCMHAEDADVVALVAQGVDTTFDMKALLESIGCHEAVVDHFCNREPRDLVKAADPLLQSVMDVNYQESAARRSTAATQAAVNRKITTGVYGVAFEDGVSGAIPLDAAIYRWMLSCAEKDITAMSQSLPTDLKSQARQDVFRELTAIYLHLDESDDPQQDAVNRVIQPWMVKYGEPPDEEPQDEE